jgi:hypothetical protein
LEKDWRIWKCNPTVQRFFNTPIDWINVQWSLIQSYYQNTFDTFVIAGDETTVTKAGKKTFGLDRFYSSLFGKPVPGLSLLQIFIIWILYINMILPSTLIDHLIALYHPISHGNDPLRLC